jgi:tripartite-type tricarboxylate transporter receptor subunit TctC
LRDHIKRLLNVGIGALISGLLATNAAAQSFPDRPVKLIVPFAAGGVTDLAARVLGQQLSTAWGQQVVVENRPGAGGLIGVEAAIRSEPNGYTILMATNGEVVIHPALAGKPRFNPLEDLAPIAMVTSTPFVWTANAASGINSLSELVSAAKAKPGALAYSSAGLGSSNHLATEQFAVAAGIKLQHIPYRGGAPAATAITAGEVPVGVVALSAAKSVGESGRVKLLAVTSKTRLKLLPDVPTVAETGALKDFESSIWTGLFAPRGTPAPILAKIQADVIEALKGAGAVERLQVVGAEAVGAPGAEMAARIKAEIEDMSKMAREAGIQLAD